jgi:hypothetical protein
LALRHSPEGGVVKTLVGASESVARLKAERWGGFERERWR